MLSLRRSNEAVSVNLKGRVTWDIVESFIDRLIKLTPDWGQKGMSYVWHILCWENSQWKVTPKLWIIHTAIIPCWMAQSSLCHVFQFPHPHCPHPLAHPSGMKFRPVCMQAHAVISTTIRSRVIFDYLCFIVCHKERRKSNSLGRSSSWHTNGATKLHREMSPCTHTIINLNTCSSYFYTWYTWLVSGTSHLKIPSLPTASSENPSDHSVVSCLFSSTTTLTRVYRTKFSFNFK